MNRLPGEIFMDIVQSAPYDIVLKGGRVVDPEQRLDGNLVVAIRGGRIAAIGKELPGAVSADAQAIAPLCARS